MSGETTITIIGNLTTDPELRFTGSGLAVAGFTVASTSRTFNRAAGAWDDGNTLFMRCSAWREMADHVAESLNRGARVIVTGRLSQRSYETREGDKRTVVELTVDEIGPSLRFATAKPVKATRNGDASSPATPQSDPWASNTPAPAAAGAPGSSWNGDEPPF
ncbi:single-stranded DNA-binding protein [Sphaerisporangium corydalis]|uniref:Single-stranded DNA-binding protein n=1 Tax=Sphaerisporangium corydalis TaxID=1441875 RepID=A0ABV9EHI0_9ACTN|nr:single-stranded DNA-binding protein [Sphaerisporangium corydalis]